MYAGEVVETRDRPRSCSRAPQHPYTRGPAVLRPGAGQGAARPSRSARSPAWCRRSRTGFAGCAFRHRCPTRPDVRRAAIPRRHGGAPRTTICCQLAPRCAERAARMSAADRGPRRRAATSAVRSGLLAPPSASIAVRRCRRCSVRGRRGARHRRRVRLRQIDARAARSSACWRRPPATVLVDGSACPALDRRERARLIQPVFQDPFSSLNPRRRVRDIVALPLVAQGDVPARARCERRVRAMLERGRALEPTMGERYAGAALRRAAPARRDRPRAGARAAHRGLRRADLGARRLGAGADPEPAGATCGASSA